MMKDKTFFLNTILAVVMGLILLVLILVRVFAPVVMLRMPDLPELVLVSAAALLIDQYLAKDAKRNYIWIFVLSAVTFGLLPLAAGFVDAAGAVKYALAGGIVFTLTTLVYTSMQERMKSGELFRGAPAVGALGLYLAAQCFAGFFF